MMQSGVDFDFVPISEKADFSLVLHDASDLAVVSSIALEQVYSLDNLGFVYRTDVNAANGELSLEAEHFIQVFIEFLLFFG
jgi:hypothetical protein